MSLRKTVKREAAHATFRSVDGSWTWYVLKTYALPKGEAKNGYARWMCLVVTPYVGENGEQGDCYIHEVKAAARMIDCTQEWADAYGIERISINEGNHEGELKCRDFI